MGDKCEFVLNETNDCICKTANHSGWKFGLRGGKGCDYILFDDVNSINMYHTDDFDLSKTHYNSFKESNYECNYASNCSCSYCTYAKNKKLNIYNECFCCKKRMYIKNGFCGNDYIRCSDCNSILCNNCFIQGRYSDEEKLYCYDCRKFTVHKNAYFYFSYNIDPYDDWMNASWYY